MPAQRQARQAKGKRENKYVIKVNMRLNRERGAVPLADKNQGMHQAFSLGNNNVIYIYSTLSCNGRFKNAYS